MTSPKEVRAWAESHGFTGRAFSHTHVRTMFFKPEGWTRGASHKVELLKISVRISALARTPPMMQRFIKSPWMWRTVAFGCYKNLVVDGKRLKGLRLSRAK